MSPDTHDVIRPGQWLSSQRRAPGRARTMGARVAHTLDAEKNTRDTVKITYKSYCILCLVSTQFYDVHSVLSLI